VPNEEIAGNPKDTHQKMHLVAYTKLRSRENNYLT